jgi:predicted Na+-dependent transporter
MDEMVPQAPGAKAPLRGGAMAAEMTYCAAPIVILDAPSSAAGKMLHQVLSQTLPFVALAFLVTVMFSTGLDLTVRQIVEPLRDRRLLVSSLASNVVLIPVISVVIARLIPMGEAMQIGIVLYALGAGTETGPKLVQLARGNAGFAVALLALLVSITVIFLPSVLSLAVPDVHVDRVRLLAKLVVMVALPLGLGVFLRSRNGGGVDRFSAVMHRAALTLLAVFVLQVVAVNYAAILGVESGAMIGGLLFFALAFVTGYLAGGPLAENRRALAIMSSIRNAPVAMAIASQVFAHDPGVLVMVTMMAVLSVLLGLAATAAMRRLAS